ncbi:hypothetical protein O5699_00475 [Escherichia coli]|nr:hypothetical protein [Escherichia coli]
MAYLYHEDIPRLLELLSGDELKAVLLCLATGGRWSEVAKSGEHVISGKVIFMETKKWEAIALYLYRQNWSA